MRLASFTLSFAAAVIASQSTAQGVPVRAPAPVPVTVEANRSVHFNEGDWRKIELPEARLSFQFPCAQDQVQRTSPDEAIGAIYKCEVQGMTFGAIVRKYAEGDPQASFDALLASARERQEGDNISLLEEFSVSGKRAFRLVCRIGVCHQDADSVSMEVIDLAPGVLLIAGADESRLPQGDQPLGRQYAEKFYSSLEISE